MTVIHQAITDADKVQDQKRSKAPLTTQDRNRTANRILDAVARIAGAGGLEFADDPKVLAEFAALKPAARKNAAKKITAKKVAIPATPAEPAAQAELLDKTG
jgi:hypothetical protein